MPSQRSCCAPGCNSNRRVSSFKFTENVALGAEWVKNLQLQITHQEAKELKLRVCIKHFRLMDDYYLIRNGKSNRLKPEAVPCFSSSVEPPTRQASSNSKDSDFVNNGVVQPNNLAGTINLFTDEPAEYVENFPDICKSQPLIPNSTLSGSFSTLLDCSSNTEVANLRRKYKLLVQENERLQEEVKWTTERAVTAEQNLSKKEIENQFLSRKAKHFENRSKLVEKKIQMMEERDKRCRAAIAEEKAG